MDQIQVKIIDIRFESEDGYQIAIGIINNTIDRVTLKGHMSLIKDTSYDLEGIYKEDYTRNEEFFLVKAYKTIVITDVEEIIKYLSSNIFEGIGRRTARKIVEVGGEDTLKLLNNNPKYFIDNGLSAKTINQIHSIVNNKDLFQLLKELTMNIEISENVFNEIYKYLKANELDIDELKQNPFVYVKKINGFSFRRADDIYFLKNNDKTFKDRITCGIETIIENECIKNGDTLINLDFVVRKAMDYLELPYDFNLKLWLHLAVENKIFYIYGDKIQTSEYHRIEFELANNILRRLDTLNIEHPSTVIETKIMELENKTKINYSPVQKQAIVKGINSKVSIITGGPGTGKTTIVNAIVNIFEDLNYHKGDIKDISEKIILCAPTGRAAQRMYETTGFKAKTIHSLLKWYAGSNTFYHNFDNPLTQDLIVIDEFSMVDMFLAHSLFRAIKPNAKIIIVGDKDQLESVLPGKVLGDLLACDKMPCIKLDQIFRLKKGNSIASLASIIQHNEKITFEKTDDIGYINANMQLVEKIKQVVDKTYAAGYNESDVQILYPKYKGIAGIDNINAYLKPKNENRGIQVGDVLFQEGDKVMQLKNDYQNDIYNGDIGYIKAINNQNAKGNETAMQIEFRGIPVNLTRNELVNITHAYAISIHKSQGSEFPVIILPITRDSLNMITKKLIYTAITRSKDKLVIIGDIECLNEGVKHNDRLRITNLQTLLNS